MMFRKHDSKPHFQYVFKRLNYFEIIFQALFFKVAFKHIFETYSSFQHCIQTITFIIDKSISYKCFCKYSSKSSKDGQDISYNIFQRKILF